MMTSQGRARFPPSQTALKVSDDPDGYYTETMKVTAPALRNADHGTVGAVAIDIKGPIWRRATSTGGISNKRPRPGWGSPLIGSRKHRADDPSRYYPALGTASPQSAPVRPRYCAQMRYGGTDRIRAARATFDKVINGFGGEWRHIRLSIDRNDHHAP